MELVRHEATRRDAGNRDGRLVDAQRRQERQRRLGRDGRRRKSRRRRQHRRDNPKHAPAVIAGGSSAGGGDGCRLGQVPSCHDVRYFSCSAVSTSMLMPMRRELEPRHLAVDLRRHRVDLLLAGRCGSYGRSTAPSAWLAKLMSMTAGGWPSAAAEVDQPALAQHPQLAAAVEAGTPRRAGAAGCTSVAISFNAFRLISTSKWPALATMQPSLSRLQVVPVDDVLVAGDGDA